MWVHSDHNSELDISWGYENAVVLVFGHGHLDDCSNLFTAGHEVGELMRWSQLVPAANLVPPRSQAYLAQNNEDNIAKIAFEVGPTVTYIDVSSI
ncbi:unnamed protein product [Bursaphelenchus xylophilus]|uniref:(pine wood nematode) hypothetical protein n=1 Tax=Bursaphelenchus xylophilus TaxID=6326 RepID=A0A1I7S503_BURXY|nr:unnamed protein product [Bursaphelenchus xylophilus]CAG9117559.1 unnamed protein product [Bursaphelenchus xylophilus]